MKPVRVIFANVSRDRPIVLTQHQVRELSQAAGRDVLDELRAMTGERFTVMGLGALMRELRARLVPA